MGRLWTCCMGLAATSLLLLAVPIRYNPAPDSQLKAQFDEYVRSFNKTYRYNSQEYKKRLNNFQRSLNEIKLLNAASSGADGHKARFGPTPFSDLSREEFAEIHLSDEQAYGHTLLSKQHDSRSNEESNEVYERRKRFADVPKKFDWRDKGYIGEVQNQGLCGACWAFSTVQVMETMAALKTGNPQSLSVQELIDCARGGNRGCSGGDICLVLAWLHLTNTSLAQQSSYPLAPSSNACKLKSETRGVTVDKYSCGSYVGREDEIISQVATHGPVAVAVNALTWQHYVGGVIQHHCGGELTELNHAVTIIGYDLTAQVPYYVAKNSWGVEFGESGYVRLSVGKNICGLANEVASIDVKV